MTTAATTGTGAGQELLSDLAASWATHLRAERKAPGTTRLYAGAVAAFTAWHQAPGPRHARHHGVPRPQDRRRKLADLLDGGCRRGHRPRPYAALRQFAAWLYDDGATDADPLLGMKPPKLDEAHRGRPDRRRTRRAPQGVPRPGHRGPVGHV